MNDRLNVAVKLFPLFVKQSEKGFEIDLENLFRITDRLITFEQLTFAQALTQQIDALKVQESAESKTSAQ